MHKDFIPTISNTQLRDVQLIETSLKNGRRHLFAIATMSENIPSSDKALNVFVQPGDGSKNNYGNVAMISVHGNFETRPCFKRFIALVCLFCEVLGDDFGLVISRGD